MEEVRPTNRADPVTRVVLTGSESVGKSTLAQQLAAHFGALVVPEFVRVYAAEKDAPLDFSDHVPVALGQMALEDQVIAHATARGDTLLLQDTDLVSTVVYCHHYFGQCPAFIEAAASERRAALYILLDIDVPWIADGIRDRGDRRDELHQLFVSTLTQLNAPVAAVSGNWQARFTQSVALIESLLHPARSLPSPVSRLPSPP